MPEYGEFTATLTIALPHRRALSALLTLTRTAAERADCYPFDVDAARAARAGRYLLRNAIRLDESPVEEVVVSLAGKCDQQMTVLDPNYTQGQAFGTGRDFQPAGRSVYAHVKGVAGAKLEQLKAMESPVNVNLWFAEDPRISEETRLLWVAKNVVVEIVGPPVDLHGLGKVWMGTGTISRKDNQSTNPPEVAG